MEGRLGALLAAINSAFPCMFRVMKIRSMVLVWMSLTVLSWMGCDGCGGPQLNRIQIDSIDVLGMDEAYFEDDTLHDLTGGSADLFAVIYVNEQLYFESPPTMDVVLPASIDLDGLVFQGIELEQTTKILIFDADEFTTEDYIGEVEVELGGLLADEPDRHPLSNGALQLELVLRW